MKEAEAMEQDPFDRLGLPSQGDDVALSVLHDGPALAAQLGLLVPAKAKGTEHAMTVCLPLQTLWESLRGHIPEPHLGRGPHAQHFGMLFGSREGNTSHIFRAKLCPTAFVWQGEVSQELAQVGSTAYPFWDHVAAATEQLDASLRLFLETTFLPWCEVSQQERGCDEAVGWFVCNDGEAFAVSREIFAMGSADAKKHEIGSPRWQKLLVVLDRALSTSRGLGRPAECRRPAVEVFQLSGGVGQRVLFDLC